MFLKVHLCFSVLQSVCLFVCLFVYQSATKLDDTAVAQSVALPMQNLLFNCGLLTVWDGHWKQVKTLRTLTYLLRVDYISHIVRRSNVKFVLIIIRYDFVYSNIPWVVSKASLTMVLLHCAWSEGSGVFLVPFYAFIQLCSAFLHNLYHQVPVCLPA
jgi:hypothetical protein